MRKHDVACAIVRLYPRAWRERYEDELLALIEQTGLGPDRALDLVVGAAREWASEVTRIAQTRPYSYSLVSTIVISGMGFVVANWLVSHVVTLPVISFVDGQRAVLPPRLPGFLAFPWYVVNLLVPARLWRRSRAAKRGRPFRTLRSYEFIGWLLALAVTTPFVLWAALVSHYGTGLPPTPMLAFAVIVICTFNNVNFSIDATRETTPSSRPELSARP